MNTVIETERLILRKLLPSDDEGMFLLDSNPNVHRFLGNNPVSTIAESRNMIENIRNQYVQNGTGRLAVILKESNEFIGWCGIKFITEPDNNHINFYEIGYRLREEFWGKGYAYEAAKACLDYGFHQMNITIMHASANIENSGSRKILEKMGMQQKNQFEWNGIPCVWYELNKTDYLRQNETN